MECRTSALLIVEIENCEYLAYLIKASLSQFDCGKLIKGFSTLILNVVNIQGASLPKILMEGWSKGFSTSIWTVEMSIKGLLYFDLVVKNSIKGLLYFDLVVETSIKVLLYFDRAVEMSTKGLLYLDLAIEMLIKGLLYFDLDQWQPRGFSTSIWGDWETSLS